MRRRIIKALGKINRNEADEIGSLSPVICELQHETLYLTVNHCRLINGRVELLDVMNHKSKAKNILWRDA